jgi:hypothetical protein
LEVSVFRLPPSPCPSHRARCLQRWRRCHESYRWLRSSLSRSNQRALK